VPLVCGATAPASCVDRLASPQAQLRCSAARWQAQCGPSYRVRGSSTYAVWSCMHRRIGREHCAVLSQRDGVQQRMSVAARARHGQVSNCGRW
jgi:hypothetical protein